MAGDDPGADVLFRQGRLYMWRTRGQRLLRLVAIDEAQDLLLFKPVALKWSADVTNTVPMPRKRALQLAGQGRLYECDEVVRKEFMSLSDDQLLREFKSSRAGIDVLKNQRWLAQRDADWEAIKDLVAPQVQAATFAPETQFSIVRAHVGDDAVRIQYVRRLLHRYAWFGLDKNALLRLESSRGHMDVLVRTFESKPGPPNALVSLEPTLKAQFGGRATRPSDIPKFIEALTTFYIGKDVSLLETYNLMVKHLYVQKSRDADGKEVVFPIALRIYP